jgi:hypothetical protein
MLFQLFRHQLLRDRPTLSSAMPPVKAMDIGVNLSLEVITEPARGGPTPVITVKGRKGDVAKAKACGLDVEIQEGRSSRRPAV